MGLRKLQADRLGFEMTTAAHEPEPPRHTQGSAFRLESFSHLKGFSRSQTSPTFEIPPT
jgi:hypothetical protein